MPIDRTMLRSRLASPAAALGLAMAAALVLALLPARWTDLLRGGAATLLRPGQGGATTLREYGQQTVATVRSHFQSAEQFSDIEIELERLREENRQLAAELASARAQPSKAVEDDDAQRLLTAQCVPARVLGRQARAFLARQHLLDAGAAAGIARDDLVVDRPALIDRGSDAELKPGQLVLSGGRIWGKVAELGPYTCAVRGVTDAGYRDLVRLLSPGQSPDGPQRPVQGMLEGTGEPLARVRLIEITEPVAEGDLVYTASGKGVLPAPLLYGRVVRVERPTGAAHWDIWMQPAVPPDAPQRVAVLRVELNPLRVAGRERLETRD
jgi:cell shape-determining protein MreC